LWETEDSEDSDEDSKKKQKGFLQNHADFGKLLASQVEGHVILGAMDSKVYSAMDGKWSVFARDLKIADHMNCALEELFSSRRYNVVKGKQNFTPAGLPRALKSHYWKTPVKQEMMVHLLRSPPVFDVHRHLVMFECGSVWDFAQMRMVDPLPEMYLQLKFPYALEPWPLALSKEYNDLVVELYQKRKATPSGTWCRLEPWTEEGSIFQKPGEVRQPT
jgi:hypothetical protein